MRSAIDAGGGYVVAAGRIVTCDESREGALGVVENGAVLVEAGRVAAVGPRAEVLARARGAAVALDAPDSVMTPGLVDAHTHAAWAGSRHGEYVARLSGASYEEIAAAGGGIVSTMRAVRESPPEVLTAALGSRLGRMAAVGVTTVEVKSGYGLDEATERKQLEAARACGSDPSLPRVVPTYLALHAVPPEARADRARYVDDVTRRWLPAIAAAGLARYVDAYVDRAAFSVDEARPLLAAARERGLGMRLHVGQFADVGGAALAAEFGASSVDHLEHVGAADLEALARAGTTAVLLPVASFTLGQAAPEVACVRAAGVAIAIASDANPGTAPTESLPLALAFAARLYGLSADEVLLGATRVAAASLGLRGEAGVLRAGASADLVVWALPHEYSLVQPWGAPPVRAVIARGRLIAGALAARA